MIYGERCVSARDRGIVVELRDPSEDVVLGRIRVQVLVRVGHSEFVGEAAQATFVGGRAVLLADHHGGEADSESFCAEMVDVFFQARREPQPRGPPSCPRQPP